MTATTDALVFDALTRAATAPAGLPLYAGRGASGLFASGAGARVAAQRCQAEGLLQVLRQEPRGKSSQDICRITDKGFAYLLDRGDVRPVLDAFVAALDSRNRSLETHIEAIRQGQQALGEFRAAALRILERLAHDPPLPAWHKNGHAESDVPGAIRAQLVQWHEAGALGDCPLPDLFQRVRTDCPAMTIGIFHDALRRLQRDQEIYLHPWTGPLYDLPEPAMALLVGHEIAYYASLRI